MLTRRTFLKTVAAVALGAMLPTDEMKPKASESLFPCQRVDHAAPPQAIRHDQWISWESPLFGQCTGVMASPPDCRGRIAVRHHSVIGGDARIFAHWNVRLLPSNGPAYVLRREGCHAWPASGSPISTCLFGS